MFNYAVDECNRSFPSAFATDAFDAMVLVTLTIVIACHAVGLCSVHCSTGEKKLA
jgi:hypothetical protein